MNRGFALLLSLLFLSGGFAFGQTKYEREYRIREDAVPGPALEFVNALKLEGKVKWYMEEGLGQKSIEAKAKHRKKRYSIEFDLSGTLQDMEVEIRRDEVDEMALKHIDATFNKDFDRYKITKIQTQYSGESAALLRLAHSGGLEEGITKRYEIIVRGRKEGSTHFYEYTFTAQGDFLHRATIVLRNADNLEF